MSPRRRQFMGIAVAAAYGYALGSYGIGLWIMAAVIPGAIVITLISLAPEVAPMLRARRERRRINKKLADYVFDPADFIEVDRPGKEDPPCG